MRVLVTGGAGFIGSHFVRGLLEKGKIEKSPIERLVVLDKLTYAGNRENLKDVENDPRYKFVQGDIASARDVAEVLPGIDLVVNFAAETHVDRSILDPGAFVRTDILGVHTLLEGIRGAARKNGDPPVRFLQISTDEVYGSADRPFRETDPLNPSSPYSASKAGGELLVQGYRKTFGLDCVITRSSNNYGPFQYPEKFIPLLVTNALDGLPLPVYGEGKNVRDWLYVEEHVEALILVAEKGVSGEVYNIGGEAEMANIDVAGMILDRLKLPRERLSFVKDRPAHDLKYSLDTSKIRALGFRPRLSFGKGLARTIEWYRTNEAWWRKIRDGAFKSYYQQQYVAREAAPPPTGTAPPPAGKA